MPQLRFRIPIGYDLAGFDLLNGDLHVQEQC